MASALYTTDILRLATSIPHLGRLDAPDGTSERRSPLCGSRIAVDVRVDADGRVRDFGQVVSACALGQASAAILGKALQGKQLDDVADARDALTTWLSGEGAMPDGWPELEVFAPALTHPARHGAILLPFEAAAEAIERALAHA